MIFCNKIFLYNALKRKARRTTPDAISIDNQLCTSKPKIADKFNNYFAIICANNIIPDIPTSHTHYLNNATESTFNFKIIDNDKQEVMRLRIVD